MSNCSKKISVPSNVRRTYSVKVFFSSLDSGNSEF